MPRPSIAAIIAAILLPPLGVFLARGLGAQFWIDTVLTILFWVPGMIFALVVVLRPDLFSRATT
jgi:uncharacterized membrane protein YqaE (UPF0057 family)